MAVPPTLSVPTRFPWNPMLNSPEKVEVPPVRFIVPLDASPTRVPLELSVPPVWLSVPEPPEPTRDRRVVSADSFVRDRVESSSDRPFKPR